MAQIPHGPEHLKCMFWQRPMSEVCHTCPMWVQIRGVDKNTGEPVPDEWMCGFRALLQFQADTVQATNQGVASTDKMRAHFTEAVRLREIQKAVEPILPLLRDGQRD